jgi:integrase
MTLKLNRLTPKFIAKVSKPGRYADGGNLYLEVGRDGNSKSFVFIYSRKRWGKTTGNIGLGSAHTVSLAQVRLDAERFRNQIREHIDPLEQRKREQQQRWLADAKNVTFRAMAEQYIEVKSMGDEAWKPATRQAAIRNLNSYLKPLLDWPVAQIEALQMYEILRPMWQPHSATARDVRCLADGVFQWATAKGAFPANIISPASMKGPLGTLLQDKPPPSTPRPSLPYQKVPALMAKLLTFKPRTKFNMREACRAVGHDWKTVNAAILSGRLPATKTFSVYAPSAWQGFWEIEPAELFKLWRQVAKVVPGLPPVSIYLVRFSILTGVRPGEARYMRWKEYDQTTGVWTLPWVRTKMGRKIRKDHIIPLSEPALAIVEALRQQQQRDQLQTEYVFANYFTTSMTSNRIGNPPNNHTVVDVLRRMLDRNDTAATMHGFRTTFGSWATDKGYPEKDIERALGHAAGLGQTHVARLYTRDATRRDPIYKMMQDWAQYTLSSESSADVVPLPLYRHRQAK